MVCGVDRSGAEATAARAAALVVGSRGMDALESLSERIGHEASCSVLVMRPQNLQED
ncbi:MAG TPA: universal stress protein [Gaiellaceae bacterium]|nr:universal stress protein [Gaiellaceae bacterium]